MKFTRSAGWVFVGLMLAASGGYAQEDASPNASSKANASAKKTRPVAKETVKPEASTLQAQSEAEANAMAEQEARQHAEAEAKKQAETEAREKPLRDADELIKNGKPADAYTLLEPLEFDRSGEVRFDYLLGIAALDSGKPDKATLAFERVLTMDPNFAGARLDMARAYYQLGDMPRAKVEFEVVLEQNPPEAARATIQKYLEAIAAREAVKQTSFSTYVEGTVGHDSNVNNATSNATTDYKTPATVYRDWLISNDGRKTADDYLGVAAGGEVYHSINPELAVYAGADARNRGNTSKTAFSSLSVDGRAGIVLGSNADSFRLGALAGQYTLASAHNRDSFGLNAEWRHAFSPSDQLIVFGQAVQYRYVDDAQKVNDFDQQAIGAGWLHMLADSKSALFGSLNYGTERDVTGNRPDGNKRFSGFRIGGQMPLNERTELFASAGGQVGDYDKPSPYESTPTIRADHQYDLTSGANWHWDKLWTVRPQLTYSRTDSNVRINRYDRTDVSVTVRRDFK